MMPVFSGSASGNRGSIDAEKMAAIRRLQSEHQILEQDLRKKSQACSGLEMDIRRLEMERDRLDIKVGEKRSLLEKEERERTRLEAEGKQMKRKINLLS